MSRETPNDTRRALRERLRDFAQRELAPGVRGHERSESLDLTAFRKLGELGLLCLTVPAEYGGAGLDATAAVIAYEELAAVDPGFALSCLAHAILFADSLARHGDERQRRRFLPDACSGRLVGGMALTEPAGGTDVLNMSTTARLDGDRYLLCGRKKWITNASLGEARCGDVFLVYARTSRATARGVSLFLVSKDAPGFASGEQVRGRLGVRSSPSAELIFTDCEVSVTDRVGPEGAALVHMLPALELERLTMAAMGLGIARSCLDIMNGYASSRVAFDQPLRAFGQIQRHLAESYAQYRAGRAYVYETAARCDGNRAARLPDADAAKLFCATMAKDVADRAIQVLGAHGYSGESSVERLWRDARLLEIGGGTLEAHQRNITRCLARVRNLG